MTVAEALVSIGAVGFSPDKPITFKSGLISPVYVDNRKLPFFPDAWEVILKGFEQVILREKLTFDVLAGIETAGIPHSAALGCLLKKPSVFVRKEVKDHGTKKRVEGGIVLQKKVLLVEDLVTTGGSSLSGVTSLREEGAQVSDCLVIISYGFTESKNAFDQAQVSLHALATFAEVLEAAVASKAISLDQKATLDDWFADPWGWAKRRNISS